MNASEPTPQDMPQEPTPPTGEAAPQAPVAGAAPSASGSAGVVPPPTASQGEEPAQRRRSRRKLIAFALLATFVFVFAGIASWYALTRKPITTVLPVIAGETLPQYSFSVYGVQKPIGIAVSPSGDRIYVAETEGQRVVRIFDGKGNQVGQAMPPKSTPATRIPVYIAVQPQTGDVYVSDRMSRAIYVYDRNGLYRRTFTPKQNLAGWEPLGLAFDQQGNIYVGNVGAPYHQVLAFAPDGTLIRTIGQQGAFNFPNGLAVDGTGNLFVADANNGRVLEFDGTGRQIGTVAHGVGEGQVGLPRGVAIDDTGRVYVVDTTGQAVYIYRLKDQGRSLAFIGLAGSEGTGEGQLEFPFGVATDTRGRMYVADWANDRVQVWSY